jgi:transposase
MKEPGKDEIKRRRRYDRNFKDQAVRLWLSSGKSAQVVAAELGINDKQLYTWRKEFEAAPKRSNAELESENLALHREIATLRQQQEVLKKTLGILSEPPPNAANGSTR